MNKNQVNSRNTELDGGERPKFFENFNLTDIVTPIKIDRFEELMKASGYEESKIKFLIDGFKNGFDIGYEGPMNRRAVSKNIPIDPKLGGKVTLWNKIMKEVELKRFAGPFKDIPFDHYMQSPVGLVPKAGTGNKSRLIFHLSYEFKDGKGSLNSNTNKDKCSVKYRDLDHAIRNCIKMMNKLDELGDDRPLVFAKSDLTSAFRILPLRIVNFKWLVLKAENPETGEIMYFVDKCLPFGASISCALFQQFSDALQFITQYAINQNRMDILTNYLDDFLFLARTLLEGNDNVLKFLDICEQIGCPVALEKTEWSSPLMVFLGILLDGIHRCLSIPEDKRLKALNLLKWFVSNRKATVKQVQTLTGILNFLHKAIVPGRAFTRRMYSKIPITSKSGKQLKGHHHVNIDKEFKGDCWVWIEFLNSDLNDSGSVLC